MKKVCSILLALVLLIVPMAISVSAAGDLNANEQKIIAELSKEVTITGRTVSVPSEYVTQAKNYFKTIDVTDAQAEEILGYIAEGEKLVKSQKVVNSTTHFNTFEPAVNSKILDLGKKAVAVTGGVLVYDGKNVTITNAEGKVVFDAAPIVKQTGAEVDFTAIVLATIAVVAILGAAIVVAKKKALFVK